MSMLHYPSWIMSVLPNTNSATVVRAGYSFESLMPRLEIYNKNWGSYITWLFHFHLIKLYSFHSSCISFYYSQLYTRTSVSTHTYRYLSILSLLITTSTDVKWHPIILVVCIFLKSNDSEHLFLYLLIIFMALLRKYLVKSWLIFRFTYCYFMCMRVLTAFMSISLMSVHDVYRNQKRMTEPMELELQIVVCVDHQTQVIYKSNNFS